MGRTVGTQLASPNSMWQPEASTGQSPNQWLLSVAPRSCSSLCLHEPILEFRGAETSKVIMAILSSHELYILEEFICQIAFSKA